MSRRGIKFAGGEARSRRGGKVQEIRRGAGEEERIRSQYL